jgi:hypothetical protein
MTEENSFFINLRNPEEILKMKSDFLILFIKEDIINSVINNVMKKTYINNIILNKLMKNKYILEIFFMKKIFRKKTKININGKYYSLREYCKLTNNKELKKLLLKYNFVKMVKREEKNKKNC